MDQRPIVTIITASFNSGLTIGDTLESIKNQTFKSYEHIVIDGGSNDTTIATLRSYQDTYNLKWISEADKGISDALNKGIRMAMGKYLLVIQADDYLVDVHILGNLEAVLNDETYDICSFPVLVECVDGLRRLHNPSKYTDQRYHFKNVFRHQGTFVHKRLYDRVGLFSTRYKISMDYDFFYRALNAGCKYYIGNQPVAVMGANGISRTENYRRIQEEILVQDSNEMHAVWRLAQMGFRILYVPYRKALDLMSRLT